MVLEQCHRDGNGSLQCPQTCEDLDPEDGELSCKRCGGCLKIAQSFSLASKSTNSKNPAKQICYVVATAHRRASLTDS